MKRYPVVSTLIAFICVVILLKLGFWQLSRAEEKRDIEEALKAKQSVVYANLIEALNDGTDDNYKSLKLTGELRNDNLLYWDNRVVEGKPGYEVISVLNTDAGFVLVNFGWVQDKSFRQSIPEVSLPTRLDGIVGTLYSPLNNVLISDSLEQQKSWPKRIQQPDIKGLEKLLKVPLLPTMAYVQKSEDYGLINNFKPVTMSPEKHVGYAIQWFSLALACLIVYVLALRKTVPLRSKSN